MKEDMSRDLIGYVERLFYHVWRMPDQYLRSLVVLFKDYVVNLLGADDQIKELKDIGTSNNAKLVWLVTLPRVEVDPFKLGDGIHVHPFGRDFGVEPELLDFNGPELVEILGGG